MASREGMAELITEARLMAEAGTADYIIGGGTYWSDEHIQTEFDKTRLVINQEPLMNVSEFTDGTTTFQDYYWDKDNVERFGTVSPEIWHLEDVGGSAVGTADYTVNYDAQHIRFDTDTLGSAYYLTYRSHDLNRVASTLWRKKAAHVAQRFDMASDNHDVKPSQLIQHYLSMAKTYAMASSPKVVTMVRTDVAGAAQPSRTIGRNTWI